MEKTNIMITATFQEQIQNLNIYKHLLHTCTDSFKGSIKPIDQDLYYLNDENGEAVCGVMDALSFYEALLQTDVSHLFGDSRFAMN